jgi:hypothetical protein
MMSLPGNGEDAGPELGKFVMRGNSPRAENCRSCRAFPNVMEQGSNRRGAGGISRGRGLAIGAAPAIIAPCMEPSSASGVGSVSDSEPIVPLRLRESGTAAAGQSVRPAISPLPAPIAFDRRELIAILTLYGRKVAAGEWRDYAIDHGSDKAVFSVFHRTAETPLYRIEKAPKLSRRQGLYSVVARGGTILRRGPDLSQVLRVLLGKPRLVTV